MRAVAVRGMTVAFEEFLRRGYRVTNRLRQGFNPDRAVHSADLAEVLARMPDLGGNTCRCRARRYPNRPPSVSADCASATKPFGEPAKYSRRIDLHQGTRRQPPFRSSIVFRGGLCIRGVLLAIGRAWLIRALNRCDGSV